ncbi:hypothetical protein FEI13_08220 [Halomonas urmiana]|uniref:Tyr recombinase domain-containing protein n=1 Tax=Halomonas urmiana TaxID=490901 RepID=A0A5R8MI57_9GAMM|nr:tyrosine-type recombinase/integrase [Halomonas urmiana]TLF51644.1 hypothetical protein FEI13_08220 [Halomonas urmiana]
MRFFSIVGKGDRAILIGPGGSVSEPFVEYRNSLIRNPQIGHTTLEAYLNYVGIFIEFVYAASELGIAHTQQNLENLMILYQSYLLDAGESNDEFVRKVAEYTDRKKGCAPQSLPIIESALLYFLEVANDQMIRKGEDSLFSVYLPGLIEKIPARQAARIKTVGWLGGVIRGGAKKIKRRRARLFTLTKISSKRPGLQVLDDEYAFPNDKIIYLINACQTHRDKTLYALLAASGIRTHEALQLQLCDINYRERLDTIKIVNPYTRSTYRKGVSTSDIAKLKYKGRSTEIAYLIEPWKTLFYEELVNYLKYEYVRGVAHNYIFHVLKGRNKGCPYFITSRKDRIFAFKRRAKIVGVDLPVGVAIHSLRHAWGFYMLNEFPTEKGRGLPKAIVSQMIGHVNITNTDVYAKYEEEKIIDRIREAEELVYSHNKIFSSEVI